MSNSRCLVWAACLFGGMLSGLPFASNVSGQTVDFNREVRPILSDKCFRCHGPDAKHREADLRFDIEEDAKADLGGYRAIVAGRPDESHLIARITSSDEYEIMPPEDSGKTLSQEEIQLLRRWIDQGAPWSRHWAYQAPWRYSVPAVKNADWPLNWIDRFLLAQLELYDLAPSPDADRVTLIRRLSFDLTGLPPAPDEVDRFVTDRDPAAYERLVDRLLASEHYGERMAMYWLDLVRYADTVGYHGDQDHNISPYRDYVIDAFNDNMPFDQFTREQLAGDLLPGATVDQQIASGYNRLLQTSHEGGVQPKEYLTIYAADRVRNLSAVWMGATVGCAQCHDHKFDPYATRDFYALAAFFADVDETAHFKQGSNSLPTKRPPEIRVLTRRERSRMVQLDKQIADFETELSASPPDQVPKAAELQQQIAAAKRDRAAIESAARTTMITVAVPPRTVRVLPRGNWLDDSGPIVEPSVPEFLGRPNATSRRLTRLDLANWLTSAEPGVGGLTARVFANRFWYLLFGGGIAKDLDDFGGQGEPPVHPALFDQLAVEFQRSGWDVKHMLKLIVMSRAYRQSSFESEQLRQRDPDNRRFARQARYRLPAEMVRDNALAVSELLVREVGGGSVKPYQPSGYYKHLNFPTRTYQPYTDQRQWRRGVYVHWQRQFLHPMLKAMDAPSREECTAQRPRSNTPLAALTLLNDPTFVEAARVFAERILRGGGDTTSARLDFAFRQAVSRAPDSYERELFERLLNVDQQRYAARPEAAQGSRRRRRVTGSDRLAAGGIGRVDHGGPRGVEFRRDNYQKLSAPSRMPMNMHEEQRSRIHRRTFLAGGGVGLGSLALASLMGRDNRAAEPDSKSPSSGGLPGLPHFAPRAKRVIFLCMAGGPSHLETFDYKPKLAELDGQPMPESFTKGQPIAQLQGQALKCQGPLTKFQKYGQHGQVISDFLPWHAKMADDLCIVRSLVTEQINHDPAHTFMNTGTAISGRPSMGSWINYGLGSESDNLPGFVVLTSVGGRNPQPIASRQWSAGFLPSHFQGVEFNSAGDPVHYVRNPAGVTREQQRELVDTIQAANRHRNQRLQNPEIETRIAAYEMAFRMQTSVPELMDLSDEPQQVLDMYGAQPGDGSYASNCLLARRLAERGVRFIHLYHRGWDHHGGLVKYMNVCCDLTDKPTWALITDLKQRGMLEDTLVIWGGEFGRTPMYQGKGGAGRDHHIKGFSMWLAGGGVKGGVTYGATDELGYHAVEDVVHIRDLHATMLHLLGIDHNRFSVQHQGLDMRLTGVEPARAVKDILA